MRKHRRCLQSRLEAVLSSCCCVRRRVTTLGQKPTIMQSLVTVELPSIWCTRLPMLPGSEITYGTRAAERETWLLVRSGSAITGPLDITAGDALFAQSDHVHMRVGNMGLVALAAYTGDSPAPILLHRLRQPGSKDVTGPQDVRAPPTRAYCAIPTNPARP
jgi:hypothetical protein